VGNEEVSCFIAGLQARNLLNMSLSTALWYLLTYSRDFTPRTPVTEGCYLKDGQTVISNNVIHQMIQVLEFFEMLNSSMHFKKFCKPLTYIRVGIVNRVKEFVTVFLKAEF
jgi:hypothetical protein